MMADFNKKEKKNLQIESYIAKEVAGTVKVQATNFMVSTNYCIKYGW